MSKTSALRAVVQQLLSACPGGTYHRRAPDDMPYPYKVFSLRSTVYTGARDDLDLCVDVWDLGADPKRSEEIADAVERALDGVNAPQLGILPTFFRDSRIPVEDPNKDIQHIQLHFQVQLYEEE